MRESTTYGTERHDAMAPCPGGHKTIHIKCLWAGKPRRHAAVWLLCAGILKWLLEDATIGNVEYDRVDFDVEPFPKTRVVPVLRPFRSIEVPRRQLQLEEVGSNTCNECLGLGWSVEIGDQDGGTVGAHLVQCHVIGRTRDASCPVMIGLPRLDDRNSTVDCFHIIGSRVIRACRSMGLCHGNSS